jgi:hypothetical protein
MERMGAVADRGDFLCEER